MAAFEDLPTFSLWEQICAGRMQPCLPFGTTVLWSENKDNKDPVEKVIRQTMGEELQFLNEKYEIHDEYEAEQPPYPDSYEEQEKPVPTVQVPLDVGTLPPSSDKLSELIPLEEAGPEKTPSVLTLPLLPEPPDIKTCTPTEFLEFYIFPVLLPGLAELLHQAKKEKCFERKRTRFIALDFLTEWLYNNNVKRKDEPFVEFFEIPFVKDWLKHHPRPPIPLSLLLTEEEASNIIQSFWKGYRVRCEPEVQELRQWQKHLRENKNIFKRVREFWAGQEKKVGTKLEESGEPTPTLSSLSMSLHPTIPQNTQVKKV